MEQWPIKNQGTYSQCALLDKMMVLALLQALQLPTAISHEPKTKKGTECTSMCVFKFYHKLQHLI
jgi:hypothetical protein